MPRNLRDVNKFTNYLERMTNPNPAVTERANGEKVVEPTFLSREVRDRGRAMYDALLMEIEGVPVGVVEMLTGFDPRMVRDKLEEDCS